VVHPPPSGRRFDKLLTRLRNLPKRSLWDDLPRNGALLTEEALIQIKAAIAHYRALIPENVLVDSPDGHGKSVIQEADHRYRLHRQRPFSNKKTRLGCKNNPYSRLPAAIRTGQATRDVSYAGSALPNTRLASTSVASSDMMSSAVSTRPRSATSRLA
jgi:hypothetical protein